jgi:hypothetical protein
VFCVTRSETGISLAVWQQLRVSVVYQQQTTHVTYVRGGVTKVLRIQRSEYKQHLDHEERYAVQRQRSNQKNGIDESRNRIQVYSIPHRSQRKYTEEQEDLFKPETLNTNATQTWDKLLRPK